MNIALIGYGKMGRAVESAAREQGSGIAAIIDPAAEGATHRAITSDALKNADVCVDFTQPGAVIENVKKVAAAGKNVVVATTGWYEKQDEVKKIVKNSGIGLIYSPNFSLGVNIFLKIVENAAGLFNSFPEYDVYAFEAHHGGKKDSPGGTAKKIGEILLEKIERKKRVETGRMDRQISPEELHIVSLRAGSIPGTHTVGFDGNADTIELTHTARGREGFALGALKAAQWIKGKKGFYSMDDMMKDIMK